MRKVKAKKRILDADPVYNDRLVTRFINTMIWEGKKNIAMNIFYDAMKKIEKDTGDNGYEVWKKAMENVTPVVEVRPKRVGGSTYQIPAEVRDDRKISLAINWLIRYSRERSGRSMTDKLASEIVAASRNEGNAFKKKEETHKMAESNKAFAHLRF